MAIPALGEILTSKDFSDQQAAAHAGKFFLVGEINKAKVEPIMHAMVRQAMHLKEQKFTLYINSNGGSSSAMLALGGLIESLPEMYKAQVVTHMLGECCSAAPVLAQFGQWRVISRNSIIMLHTTKTWGGSDYKKGQELRILADENHLHNRNMADILARRNSAGHSDPDYWIENFFEDGQDHYMRASHALELGLVDEVI